MRIGYTGWTWLVNHKDNYQWEFEQFLKEVADLGYECVENFAFISDYFDNDALKLKGLLDRYGLELVNMYQHFSDEPEKDYENALRYVDFMKHVGVKYLNMQGVMWEEPPLDRPTDAERIRMYAELSNLIGRLCKENGMVAVYHPHACTPVYTEEQIELFLQLSDPEYVYLCLDTAHTTLSGMDPVRAFEKFLPRLGYVHLKDVDPDKTVHPEWPMKRFCALGTGTVDFKGIVKVLRNGGYDGVLCVELDNPKVCNYKSAMISRRYIHDVLGM